MDIDEAMNPSSSISQDELGSGREVDEESARLDVWERDAVHRRMANYKHSATKVNVMVIGTIGSGKSATANMLLGRREFKEGDSAQPVTKRFATAKMDALNVTVVDSPGCWNVGVSADIDFHLLVINLACPYFDNNTHQYLRKLKGGGGIELVRSGRCMAVLTHADTRLGQYPLDTYLDQLQGQPLHDFLTTDMKDRYMAVNNAAESEYERQRTHKVLVTGIVKSMSSVLAQKDGDKLSLLTGLKQALMKRLPKDIFTRIELPPALGSADAKVV